MHRMTARLHLSPIFCRRVAPPLRRLAPGLVSVALWAYGCSSSSAEPAPPLDASAETDARIDGGMDAGPTPDVGLNDSGTTTAPACPGAFSRVGPGMGQELFVQSHPNLSCGIFDPYPVYPAGAATGVMTYTSVLPDEAGNCPGGPIETHIAVSSDQGRTWTHVAQLTRTTTVTVTARVPNPTASGCVGRICSGQMLHEVSAIVADPLDPNPKRRWKVLTHTYLDVQGGEYVYGYIALWSAPIPGGPWRDEGALFGWPSDVPLSSEGAAYLLPQVSGAEDCIIFTEPSIRLRDDGDFDLVVGCALSDATIGFAIDIRLVRIERDGLAYVVRRLLSGEDAPALGGDINRVNAGHLFEADGRWFLSATPDGIAGNGQNPAYRGCAIVPMNEDINDVVRESDGTPRVCRFLDSPNRLFTGACAYAEGASAMGYLVPQLVFEADLQRPFRIFRSGIAAP